jgi:hypothetical protein
MLMIYLRTKFQVIELNFFIIYGHPTEVICI